MDILAFCRKRDISTSGITIRQLVDWNRDKPDQSRITLQIDLPPYFPEKYDEVLGRAVDRCLVANLGRGLDETSFDRQISRIENSEESGAR